MRRHLISIWIPESTLVSAGQDARHTYHYYLPLQAYLNDMLATNDMRVARLQRSKLQRAMICKSILRKHKHSRRKPTEFRSDKSASWNDQSFRSTDLCAISKFN